jgi:hypothetical protein
VTSVVKENIFGGFTPVKRESRGGIRADPSLKSFLVTLKNPHNLAVGKFALKAEEKSGTIYCDRKAGPGFGWNDIGVSDNCNANTNSRTHLGRSYEGHRTAIGGYFHRSR